MFVSTAVELRVVERVERFEPELQLACVRPGSKFLNSGEVQIVHAGSAQDVAPGVAELPERRLRERRGVEPLLDGAAADVGIADDVRPGSVPKLSMTPPTSAAWMP